MNEGSDSVLNETLQIISMVLCLVGILQVLVGPKRWKGSVHFHITFYICKSTDDPAVRPAVLGIDYCAVHRDMLQHRIRQRFPD